MKAKNIWQAKLHFKMLLTWDFPGGPGAKTWIPDTGGQGLIPGQGTRSHMLQLRPDAAK